MTIDLDALEATAKAATPGPWRHPGRALVVSRMSEDEPLVCDCISEQFAQAPKNAAYIAAANPAVVLALIATVRQAQAERDWLANDIATKDGNCPPILQDCTDIVCTTDVCQQCWLNAAREAVEGKQ